MSAAESTATPRSVPVDELETGPRGPSHFRENERVAPWLFNRDPGPGPTSPGGVMAAEPAIDALALGMMLTIDGHRIDAFSLDSDEAVGVVEALAPELVRHWSDGLALKRAVDHLPEGQELAMFRVRMRESTRRVKFLIARLKMLQAEAR